MPIYGKFNDQYLISKEDLFFFQKRIDKELDRLKAKVQFEDESG